MNIYKDILDILHKNQKMKNNLKIYKHLLKKMFNKYVSLPNKLNLKIFKM